MRVLMVQCNEGWSGGEVVAHEIAKGAPGIEAIFVVPGTPTAETLARYAPFRVIPAGKPGLGAALANIRKAVRDEKPDVIHAHGTRAKFWCVAATMGMHHAPIIYSVHGFHLAYRPWLQRMASMVLETTTNWFVTSIVTTTKADQRLILAWHTTPAKKTHMIGNGIDPKLFENASAGRGREIINMTGANVVIPARLHPQKDIQTAFRAWPQVLGHVPHANLVLVGEGPLRGELEALAEELGISEHVRFVGNSKDMPDLLAAADVVALPTHWEGMVLVALEAGAASKPMVITDVPGIDEIIVDGETGLLVKENDAADFAEKITTLLLDPARGERIGRAAHERIVTSFTNTGMAAGYKQEYERMLHA